MSEDRCRGQFHGGFTTCSLFRSPHRERCVTETAPGKDLQDLHWPIRGCGFLHLTSRVEVNRRLSREDQPTEKTVD
jgi:hypothetical protein